ncbi:MAG: hypothetical protein Q9219_005070 [cf. Caloplaca sp. 3 TL-2023]
MRCPYQQLWLAWPILVSILTVIINAYPSDPRVIHRTATQKNTGSRSLYRRNDPFLGEDWEIATMENHEAYVPHESAARDLEDFYTSLQTVALHPIVQPGHYFVHRINRVLITFHCPGLRIPMHLILRFATKMLNFTRLGYTSSYTMQFRHAEYGFILTVIMTIDDPPPSGPQQCTFHEEHGEVNQSGIRQVCVLRPPGPSS